MNFPWIGSNYGGWNTPIDQSKDKLVYSFGIGHDYTWDAEVSEAGAEVHMFDPTPESIAFIAEHDITKHGLTFHQWGIHTMDEPVNLYHHLVPEYDTRSVFPGGQWEDKPECTVPMYRLGTIIEKMGSRPPDWIKLCLGGDHEYWIVNQILDYGYQPEVLILLALHFSQEHQAKLMERLTKNEYVLAEPLTNPARWTLCKS